MEIPKGWRLIRQGTRLKVGDRFYVPGRGDETLPDWPETRQAGDIYTVSFGSRTATTYIRRIKTK